MLCYATALSPLVKCPWAVPRCPNIPLVSDNEIDMHKARVGFWDMVGSCKVRRCEAGYKVDDTKSAAM